MYESNDPVMITKLFPSMKNEVINILYEVQPLVPFHFFNCSNFSFRSMDLNFIITYNCFTSVRSKLILEYITIACNASASVDRESINATLNLLNFEKFLAR